MDGIGRDFEHALQVVTGAGLEYAELQYLWDKEVSDLSDDEMARAKSLVDRLESRLPASSASALRVC